MLETERLILRRWRPDDREPFAVMNACPDVTEFLPGPMSREESDACVDRLQAHFDEHGYGLWAVEVKGGAPFIGFVGLLHTRYEAAFTPCVEIGWRLAADHWGRGYATEAARAVLAFAFDELGLDEVVSMTVPANHRSRRVVEKIGMTQCVGSDFAHPLVPADHPLSLHVLYRMQRPA